MAHAKNVAALLARGRLVLNSDADAYDDDETVGQLLDAAAAHGADRVLFHGGPRANLGGRIGVARDAFLRLGGYDERMDRGWGAEDCDFKRRAARLGLREVLCDVSRAVPHGDDERVRHGIPGVGTLASQRAHARIMAANDAAGATAVNHGRRWGFATVTRNFEPAPLVVWGPDPSCLVGDRTRDGGSRRNAG